MKNNLGDKIIKMHASLMNRFNIETLWGFVQESVNLSYQTEHTKNK